MAKAPSAAAPSTATTGRPNRSPNTGPAVSANGLFGTPKAGNTAIAPKNTAGPAAASHPTTAVLNCSTASSATRQPTI